MFVSETASGLSLSRDLKLFNIICLTQGSKVRLQTQPELSVSDLRKKFVGVRTNVQP